MVQRDSNEWKFAIFYGLNESGVSDSDALMVTA